MTETESKGLSLDIENYINDFPNTMEPCTLCAEYKKKTCYNESCRVCCWYYGSKFKLENGEERMKKFMWNCCPFHHKWGSADTHPQCELCSMREACINKLDVSDR